MADNCGLLAQKCSYLIWVNRYNSQFEPWRISVVTDAFDDSFFHRKLLVSSGSSLSAIQQQVVDTNKTKALLRRGRNMGRKRSATTRPAIPTANSLERKRLCSGPAASSEQKRPTIASSDSPDVSPTVTPTISKDLAAKIRTKRNLAMAKLRLKRAKKAPIPSSPSLHGERGVELKSRMKSVTWAAKLTEVRYFELVLSAEERKRWLARKRNRAAKKAGTIPVKQAACNYGSRTLTWEEVNTPDKVEANLTHQSQSVAERGVELKSWMKSVKKAGTIPVKQAACNYGSRTLTWEEVNTPDKVEANLTHQSQSVAGILSGDDWLRDSDVHAVFSLVVRTASRSRRSLQFQPQNAYPVDKNNLLSSLRRGDNIFGDVTEDVLFVPVNWSGSHWVLVIVDLRDSGRTIITYVDPLGGLVPALLKAAFTTRYDGAIFTQTSDRLQYDCCHCGVWCAIIAEHYLECCRSSCFDPACFELSHPKFVCNAVSLEHRRRNTSFIARRRRLYSAFL